MSGTAKILWFIFLAGLVVLAALGFAFPYKGHFGLDELPLFGVWFAVGVAVAVLMVAKIVAAFLQRGDSYYG